MKTRTRSIRARKSVYRWTDSQSERLAAGGVRVNHPPLTLYVHLPWCVRKCPYCDFNSHEVRGVIPEDDYLSALLHDLDSALPLLSGRSFETVFIGGGTPSLFSPRSIAKLLNRLRGLELLQTGAEVTLEANPGAADEGRFRGYRDAGVNRLSVGVQSFDDDCLQALGRIHGAQEARRAAEMAAAHFENFNLDLMYGLPGQTPESAAADAVQAIALGAPHLSCYQLTLEPNTVFAKYPPPLPPEHLQAAIEEGVHEQLAAAGYRHYEVSAHARPERECRHNRHYWEFADYLGIGAGAQSKLTHAGRVWREARVRGPDSYLRRVSSGTHVVESRELPVAQRVAEFMMNALRLSRGFRLDLMGERTGSPEPLYRDKLESIARQGFVDLGDEHVVPTALGRRYLNRALVEFLPD